MSKKPIHEIITPIAFYHFIFSLITYLIFGLIFDPTFITQVWFMPNMVASSTMVMIIGFSRLKDKRYRTLFVKYAEYYR